MTRLGLVRSMKLNEPLPALLETQQAHTLTTGVFTLLLLLLQILILYSRFLFSFSFFTPLCHNISQPATPLSADLLFSLLTSSLTHFYPNHRHASSILPFCIVSLFHHLYYLPVPSSSSLDLPATGFPLVSRGKRQPAHSSDQSRAAGLPSYCW